MPVARWPAALPGASGNAARVARYTDGIGWQILGGSGEDNAGNGINQWGDVVGTGLLGTLRQGLIYTDNLGLLAMIDDLLLVPGSWRILAAYDINDAQQITGWAIDTATGLRSAVLLTPVSPPPPNQPPIAKFTYTCTASLFCSFDGSGSTDDRGILAWVWTVDGQKIGVLQSKYIGVQFDAPQTINLTLTVTDTRGITNSVYADGRDRPAGARTRGQEPGPQPVRGSWLQERHGKRNALRTRTGRRHRGEDQRHAARGDRARNRNGARGRDHADVLDQDCSGRDQRNRVVQRDTGRFDKPESVPQGATYRSSVSDTPAESCGRRQIGGGHR